MLLIACLVFKAAKNEFTPLRRCTAASLREILSTYVCRYFDQRKGGSIKTLFRNEHPGVYLSRARFRRDVSPKVDMTEIFRCVPVSFRETLCVGVPLRLRVKPQHRHLKNI